MDSVTNPSCNDQSSTTTTEPKPHASRWQPIAGSGFPHSEMSGSKLVRSSPDLIAAYHVLHRLSAPRHPPDTLKTLDRFHYRCPIPLGRRASHPAAHAARQPDLGIDPFKDHFASKHTRRKPAVSRPSWAPLPRRRPDPKILAAARQNAPVHPCRTALAPIGHQTATNQTERFRSLQDRMHSLFTMSNNPPASLDRMVDARCERNSFSWTRTATRHPKATQAVVELDGIEPTTSCLQSRRSPS